MAASGIGIIDPKRLQYVPEHHHAEHEFCFHLHDLMARLLVEAERSNASAVSFSVESDEERELLEKDHILEFLSKTGRRDVEKRFVINHISIALFADALHFIMKVSSLSKSGNLRSRFHC